MPHKNRKYKKKTNTTPENKCATSGGQLQPKEIEQVAAILKSSDLSEVPLIISLAILQKKDAIAKLLKRGCKIDEFGPNQKTALMWSVQYKNFAIIELLLKNGADCSLEDQNGNCFLSQALEDPSWEQTTFLSLWELVKGTKTLDVDHCNKVGETLLYLAVKREWTQAVIVLIGKKANVNIANSSGAAPLMLAAFHYNESIVEILLQTGADVFKRDEAGRTALCYTISTVVLKCLQPPFVLIDLLLSEMEAKGYCLQDYLKHVVECSSTDTLAHVVVFTVTHIPNGVKLLLEANSFNATLKVFQSQHKDLNEQKTLLMVVAEVLSHDSTSEANKNFFATKFPQACLEILQSESINDAETFLKGETIHLLILACGDTEEGANFLRNNMVIILKNYDRCFESFLLQRYENDDPANQTVQYKIKLFQEQLQKMKSESEFLQGESNEQQTTDDDDTTLVTAIKFGVQQLQEELDREDSKSDVKCKKFDLNELLRLKQQSSSESVDCIISYLEEVLQRIVTFYQSHWKYDGDLQKTHEESLQIQRLQERFKSLANTIKESFPLNPTTAQLVLDQLETVLLQHSVRGKTVVEILTTTNDFSKSEDTGDQLYFKEIALLSKEKEPNLELQEAARKKTMEHAYHLFPSLNVLCDEEDFEMQPNKTILKSSMGSMSRWCGLLERLNGVSNCMQLLGGDVRVGSREKRGSYIISTSGNFNPVEIGLDINSRPLAIKKIPKASCVCRSLKLLINPLLGLRNTHILHYFACDFEENELILATPLCEYNIGEYITYMRQNSQIPFLSSNTVVCQFLSGLKFLHEFKEPIVHGNLKPSNIFIDLHGIVRIAEFGIHKALFQLNEAPASSTIWFARETYESFKKISAIECTRPSDIHVAGMLLHFILTDGKHPYGEEAGEILVNLEKAAPQLSTCDMDLQDLITWMLLFDPKDRPTISQVLSHVFFWPREKRWNFILTCSGVGANMTNLNIDELHTTINNTARKDDIKGSWVLVVKRTFPKFSCVNDDDTPTGLLRFIKLCHENQILINFSPNDLCGYILASFPALTLSLYRMLESTSWLGHPAFLPFLK